MGKATMSGPVFIVPDAAIHLVDFATLPTGTRGYLVDAPIALHYLLAERDLVEPRAEPRGHSLLALGAPDFDRVDRAAANLATHGFFLDRTCGMVAPGARGVTQTARLLDESPLLRSGLVLAGANQRARASANSDDEDGILTAEEIAGLDLSETQWAVLSACDTGRGDWQPSEGILGLRRAFDVAGARTVILSLWPVIDTVASQWMTELYRAKFIRNTDTAIAVRTASRTLLANRRTAGQSTHPLYWSGFIATGDWR